MSVNGKYYLLKSYKGHSPPGLSWAIWGIGAGLFLFGFFHRVAPGVLTRELSQDFGLTATSLGGLSGLYFYSYVAMQVPTGVLVDRIGPQRLLAVGGLLTAVGTLLFAFAPTLFWAGLGRFIIGGSVAVAFVSTLKLTTHWFAPQQYSLAVSFLLVAGMIGAVFAGVPLQVFSEAYGWREIMAWSALTGILVCALAIWFVRDDPGERGYLSHCQVSKKDVSRGMLSGLGIALTYRNTWLLAVAAGGMIGAVLTFAGLWGVPFLTDVYKLSPAVAATICSTILLSWAVGGPVFSIVSEKIKRRRTPYLIGCILALVSWSVVFLIPNLSVWVVTMFLLFAGLCSGGMMLGFSLAKESVPVRLAGTVSGLVNTGVMGGPMLLQPLVGWLLDRMWNGEIGNGARIYDVIAYRTGFSIVLAWLVISVVVLVLARESGCRQLEE